MTQQQIEPAVNIRNAFLAEVEKGCSYEDAIAAVAPLLNRVPNAQNFQLTIDFLHWHWEGAGRPPIPVQEQDRIALKYSRFGEYQEAEIQKQVESADEWQQELEEAGLEPLQALSLAKLDCELEVAHSDRNTAIATHPSPIATPQEIVRLYRLFYRAEKKYQPERTNVLKPLLLVKEVIQHSRSTGEELSQEILGRLVAFMGQVRRRAAKGRWVVANTTTELKIMKNFADFIVFNVLEQKFGNDKAKFSSQKGIGLIEDACYALYVLEQDKENK